MAEMAKRWVTEEMYDKVWKFLADRNERPEAKAVLKWQWQLYGDFFTALFAAIARADDGNLERLRLGFPIEVTGFIEWNRSGLADELRRKGVMD